MFSIVLWNAFIEIVSQVLKKTQETEWNKNYIFSEPVSTSFESLLHEVWIENVRHAYKNYSVDEYHWVPLISDHDSEVGENDCQF